MLKVIELFGDVKVYVGECGEIKTFDKIKIRKNGRADNRKGKVIKPTVDKYGYHKVTLSDGDVRKTYTVHRLVAMAFIPNPENKPTVNHINGNKLDNRVSNLEWATQKEQKTHSIKTGLCKNNIEALQNANRNRSIPIAIDGVTYVSIREACRQLHICESTAKRMGVIA